MKTTHPKDWYIQVTEENHNILNDWRLSKAINYRNHELNYGVYVLSEHYKDGSFYFNDDEYHLLQHHPGYVKIDLETFLEITKPKNIPILNCW